MTYSIWCPEYGQDESTANNVDAPGPKEAAEAWADRKDWSTGKFAIVGGTTVDVVVRHIDGTLQLYSVSGQYVATYTARVL